MKNVKDRKNASKFYAVAFISAFVMADISVMSPQKGIIFITEKGQQDESF